MKMPEAFYKRLITFLFLIQDKILKQFKESYNDQLTPMQFHVVTVFQMYGSMPMSALAETIGLPKQSATKIVNQLVGMGFVCRSADPRDRRIILVDNTRQAKDYLHRFTVENMKGVCRHFESLDETEFAELNEAIQTINRILPRVSGRQDRKNRIPETE